jgi:large subunit ribosomal protein L10
MRSEKIQLAEDVAKFLVGAKFAYFVTYKGLKMKEMNAFRNSLAKSGAECHVLKNRVVRKVAELKGLTALANYRIVGDTAVIVGQDAGQTAKVIDEFTKSSKGVLAPKAGYLDGLMLTDSDVKAIADLPSKDVLRAQLLGVLIAAPTGLVSVLNAKVTSIVNVVNAYKSKLEKSEAPAAN